MSRSLNLLPCRIFRGSQRPADHSPHLISDNVHGGPYYTQQDTASPSHDFYGFSPGPGNIRFPIKRSFGHDGTSKRNKRTRCTYTLDNFTWYLDHKLIASEHRICDHFEVEAGFTDILKRKNKNKIRKNLENRFDR